MKEVWKPIKNYEGLYEVSNLGRIKSLARKVNDYRGKNTRTLPSKIMNNVDNGNGYEYVTLVKNKKRKNYYIHRLVAFTFLPNPNNYEYVNHLDYNTKNNIVSNLELCTQKNNVNYSIENMKHRKSVTHTNTGERYIYYRKNKNVYRVVIDKKEYPSFKTLEEAIKKRDEILNGKR